MCFAIPIPRNTLNPASVHLACSQRDYSPLTQPCTLRPSPAPETGRSGTLPSLPLDLTLQTPSSSPRHHVPSQAPRHRSPHESHRPGKAGWGPFQIPRLRQTMRLPSQLRTGEWSQTKFCILYKIRPPKKILLVHRCKQSFPNCFAPLLQALLIRYLHQCAQLAF